MGRFHASLVAQRVLAAVASSVFSAESEPPKSTRPALKFLIPAPEPVGLYSMVAFLPQASP